MSAGVEGHHALARRTHLNQAEEHELTAATVLVHRVRLAGLPRAVDANATACPHIACTSQLVHPAPAPSHLLQHNAAHR